MSNYIMAIDQGTTGTTVSILSKQGQIIAKANNEFEQLYPKPGWVEHDPESIWETVTRGIRQCLEKSQISSSKILAIGITNQRETSVLWNRNTGKPYYNAIVWQCRRTTDFCARIKKRGLEKKIFKKTGLKVDPYFSASKYRWILDNVKGLKQKARAGEVAAGTIDSFLVWKLSHGKSHITDVSNASRTQLMDLKKVAWDDELLKTFGVPKNILPKIVPSSGVVAATQNVPGLPDGIPISGIAGDQQAALFGQACFKEGEAKCTYGTGSFILMNIGAKPVASKAQLLTTVAWQLESDEKVTYALEGGAFICGAAVQWLRDELCIIDKAFEVEDLAKKVEDSGGVDFVPALAGLGAPYWNPEARGTITGLTRGSSRSHLARATLDAMALQNVDILRAMEKDSGKKMKNLKVDGGASANELLMQLQSDYLGSSIVRPKVIETTVAGAAFLAGLGVGFWKSKKEIKEIWQKDKEFKKAMTPTQRQKRIEQWNRAVKRAL